MTPIPATARTPLIRAVWPDVVAVDLSLRMLSRSAQPCRIQEDASRLPLANGCADVVVLGDGPLFAAEVARVLVDGAPLIVSNALGDGAVPRARGGTTRGDGHGHLPSLERPAERGPLGHLDHPAARLTMTGIWRGARESRYDPFGMKDPCAHGEPIPGCCLVRQLRLTRTGDWTFTGMTRGGRSAAGRSFGGGLAAQALLAAGATVPDGQAPGSLHAYFVTPGDASRPVRYTVTTVGEGQSWALRQVTAGQDGTVRLAMHTSFRRFGATSGNEHQRAAPTLGTPPAAGREPGDHAPQDGGGDPACTCEAGRATPPCGLDIEPAAVPEAIEPSAAPGAHRATWLRARHGLGELPLWHAALLTYASDLGTIHTVDQPHAGEPGTRRAASVDHAVWFHRPFRFDDWLWYGQRSPVLTGGRGMFEGSFYDDGGNLVASCAQEVSLRRSTRPRDHG